MEIHIEEEKEVYHQMIAMGIKKMSCVTLVRHLILTT